MVKIDSKAQMESFLFALENDDKGHRSYRVRELVRNFIIEDDDHHLKEEDKARVVKFWPSAIWTVTQTLDMSVWKELEISVPLIDSISGEMANRTYRLPYSTTLARYSPWSAVNRLDYSAVIKLRFRTVGQSFSRLAKFVDYFTSWQPNITHIAVIGTSWPANDHEVRLLNEAAKKLKAILVMMWFNNDQGDAEEEAAKAKAKAKGRELLGAKVPRLLIWEDYSDGDTFTLYNDCYSDSVWNAVETELADLKNNGKTYEE
jgi:hypothetical protein